MLDRAIANEVIRQAKSGRTRPVLMVCTAEDAPVEVFCKLSAGCFEGVTSLAREVLAACLAADLDLPVPVPYLVEIPQTLVSLVANAEIAEKIRTSSPVGFGSERVGNQFGTWTATGRLTDAMLTTALGTLVFDAVIDNTDRKPSNPNCLVAGERLRLIDHELAFPSTAALVAWQPPWQTGSLQWLNRYDGHIFCQKLKGRRLDFDALHGLWSAISDARLLEYRNNIPVEWKDALPAVDEVLDRIGNARDNFDGVVTEIERVLR